MSPSPEKVRSEGSTTEEMQARAAVKDFLNAFARHLAQITGKEVDFCGFIIDCPDDQFIHPVFIVGDGSYAAGAKNFSSLFLIQHGYSDEVNFVDWGGEIGKELYRDFGRTKFYPFEEKGKWTLSLGEDRVKRGRIVIEHDNPVRSLDFICGIGGSSIVLNQGLCRAAGVKSLDEISLEK